MAILQISQIQVRRGLQQDLPQLASGEMGWSLDTRRLFIGNGTTDEGAPTLGITEILTEYSNLLSLIGTYTFKGTEAGYTSQTGTSLLNPISRTLQSRLDDVVNLKNFGAVGDYDGVSGTDNTAAINRAIQEIYVNSLNESHSPVRRIIYFPAGNYLVSDPILIPPNCTIMGEGKNNTIISRTSGTVFITCDSSFQTVTDLGMDGAALPSNISISRMKLEVASGSFPVLDIDSTSKLSLNQVTFNGPSTISQLVIFRASVGNNSEITFDDCVFSGAASAMTSAGPLAGLRIKNSSFINLTSDGVSLNYYITGFVSEGNYFSSVPTPIVGITGNNYSFGDYTATGYHGGIYVGAAKSSSGKAVSLLSGTNTITNLGAMAKSGQVDYQLTDGSNNYRYGTLKFNYKTGAMLFDDEYTESATSLSANVFANNAGYLTCSVTGGSSTLTYNLKQFV